MLSGTGFCNNPVFAQPFGKEDLPNSIVYLMGPGMA
jgi:hypothetical protein